MAASLKRVEGQAGFTLIEVLVAVMIMAIAMTVLLQIFSGGLKSSVVSKEYSIGILHAREKMEELLLLERLSPLTVSGAFEDGYTWQARIDLHDTMKDEGLGKGRVLSLFQISLNVYWQGRSGGKEVSLMTLTIAAPIDGNG